MFRDSHGVVHTVASADPLDDLPPQAATALAAALLRPEESDIGTALERCEGVRVLLERWQSAFFAALPDEVDLVEEARWAEQAGLSLAEVEASYALEDDLLDEPELIGDHDTDPLPGLDVDDPLSELDRELLDEVAFEDEDDLTDLLPEELVSVLERDLMLLTERYRLEALIAASDLVAQWSDLLADHEKLLGHLVLTHRLDVASLDLTHPAGDAGGDALTVALARRHAHWHAEHGVRHPDMAPPQATGQGPEHSPPRSTPDT